MHKLHPTELGTDGSVLPEIIFFKILFDFQKETKLVLPNGIVLRNYPHLWAPNRHCTVIRTKSK